MDKLVYLEDFEGFSIRIGNLNSLYNPKKGQSPQSVFSVVVHSPQEMKVKILILKNLLLTG